MLLGEDSGDDEPLFVGLATSSRSPNRQWSEALSQSSHHYHVQDDEAPESDESDEYLIPAPPKRRRRSSRQKLENLTHDVLKSLVSHRKLKSMSGPRGKTVTKKSEQLKRPRRLPVNELLTVTERFDNSDLDNDDSELVCICIGH